MDDSSWPVEPFTLEILAELRADRFSLRAWTRFLARAWQHSRETASREPQLARSWLRLTVGMGLASSLPIGLVWRREGGSTARRMWCRLLAGLTLQQANAYLHLGMNRRLYDNQLLPHIGMATTLSYLRGACGYTLLATTGKAQFPTLGMWLLVVGSLTDVVDGRIARRQGRTTKLGAYADGEADVVLAVALIQRAVYAGELPLATHAILIGRYVIPVLAAMRLALLGKPPSIAHTKVGQVLGVVATSLTGCALAPEPARQRLRPLQRVLLPLALALSVMNAIAQVRRLQTTSHVDWKRL